MSTQNDLSPELSGQRTITGLEPELPGKRKCPACGSIMQMDMFGKLRCMTCFRALAKNATLKAPLDSDPKWFHAGSTTPTSHIRNVRGGLHPFGSSLSDDPQATCGNCDYHVVSTGHANDYHKCRLMKNTGGPGTDLRVKWRGCSQWQPEIHNHPMVIDESED